jgi:hypothetical protein
VVAPTPPYRHVSAAIAVAVCSACRRLAGLDAAVSASWATAPDSDASFTFVEFVADGGVSRGALNSET